MLDTKHILPLSGLVIGLSSCLPYREKYQPPPTPEEMKYIYVPHSLKDDEILLAALRDFYCQSSTLETVQEDPLQHLVVLRWFDNFSQHITFPDGTTVSGTTTVPNYAHGYLMDDCGLILTSYHHMRNWMNSGKPPMSMIDGEGHTYPTISSDFLLPQPDYALALANTGKQPSSHPLKFHSSLPDSSFRFASFHPSSYFTEDISLPMKITHVKGNTISLEDFLFQIGRLRYARCSNDFDLDFQVEESVDACEQRNTLYLSKTVYAGNSGTPLFAEDFTFKGLVCGYWIPRVPEDGVYRTYCGFGLATPVEPFIHSLEDYLQIEPSSEKGLNRNNGTQ